MSAKTLIRYAGCLLLAASTGLCSAMAAAQGLDRDRIAVLDRAIQAEVDKGRIAGMVVAVARNGRVVLNKAYGYSDRENREAMTTDHLFRLYSMTKPVTSVALMMLYEEGRFQLTDPIENYIPELRDLKVFAGYDSGGNMILEEPKRKPTIQDAFRHTMGLSGGLGGHAVDAIYREHGLLMAQLDSLRQEVVELGKVPLRYQPGEEWVYGLNHDVQAYLVEVLSGMPFAQFLQERLFDPLGMKDTMFGVPADRADDFARVYVPNGEGGILPQERDSYARFTDHHFATLSLSSSTGDYLKFARMLLNGGELDGVKILSRKSVEMMSSNHLPAAVPSINNGRGEAATGYGLGMSVTLNPALGGNMDSVGSFGWGGAATTNFRVDPAENMTYVIMGQTFPSDGAMLAKVQTLIYQALE